MPSAFNKNANEVTPRRVGLYPVLDRYVLKEFMIPFAVLIMAFMIMFLIGDVFNDLEDFLKRNASLGTIFTYFMLKLPGNIRFIMPISVLLACMYTMANFGKHMEITAMRSSGVSLIRCSGSIFMVGLIMTGLNFYFNEQLVPYTERAAFMLLKKVTRGENYQKRLYSMLSYRSPDKQRTWLFKYFDNNGNHQEVTLKKYRADGSLEWDINAEEASCTPNGWIFRKAVFTPYTSDGLLPKSSMKYAELTKTMTDIPEKPKEIADAVKPPEELPSWTIFQLLMNTRNMAESCKHMYATILFNRLAFPWSCFLAVFLGIPLATKNERSGIFLAIITALVVIVVYQIMTEVFLILGKQGVLNPVIAGLSPTVGFILYGWYNSGRRL